MDSNRKFGRKNLRLNLRLDTSIKISLPLMSENMDLTQDELAFYSVLSKNIKKLVDIEGTGRGYVR